MKLQARLADNEAKIDSLQKKLTQLEKSKLATQENVGDMGNKLSTALALNNALEKKSKQNEVAVAEWKQKVDGLALELDFAQKETRKRVVKEIFVWEQKPIIVGEPVVSIANHPTILHTRTLDTL